MHSASHYVLAAGYGIDFVTGQRYALLHDPEYDRGYMALYESDLAAMGNNITKHQPRACVWRRGRVRSDIAVFLCNWIGP